MLSLERNAVQQSNSLHATKESLVKKSVVNSIVKPYEGRNTVSRSSLKEPDLAINRKTRLRGIQNLQIILDKHANVRRYSMVWYSMYVDQRYYS